MQRFVANREVLIGKGSLNELPSVLEWYGRGKVFLAVFSTEAECVLRAQQALQKAGIEYVLYDKILGEPDLEVVDQGVEFCLKEGCDAIVAIGGGSVIDTSKAISMIAANGGKAVEYQFEGRQATKQPLLFIAVPTTAGTGAEATKVSVLYNREKGFKKSVYHTSMIAQTAILDPIVLKGMPQKVTAATGMDAITHAVESYISVDATEISRMYSLKALKLLADNLVRAYSDPEDEAAQEAMLLGSYLAGYAISAGTCLAHIVGQPIGAIFKIPHGDACSIYLIPSIELNRQHARDAYVDIAKTLGVDASGKTPDQMIDEAVQILTKIRDAVHAPSRLTDYVSEDKIDIPMILDNIQTSMGHIKTNPRQVSRELFEQLLRMAL